MNIRVDSVDEDAPEVEFSSPTPEPSAGVGRFRRHWPSVWHPVAIFIASRLATLLAAATAAELSARFTFGGVLAQTWDGIWYVKVAEFGYPHAVPEGAGQAVWNTTGFFPLYPLTIRAVHWFGLSYEKAGLVVSAAAGLAACLLLWRLVCHRSGPATADRAVALFCFFPGAMVLSLVYSEALLLALAIGCLYALLHERWVTAGLLAALATATRPNAVALVAACAWAAAAAIWQKRQWRALAAPALAPLGLVSFFAFLGHHTGEAGAYLRSQREGWDQVVEPASTYRVFSTFVRQPFGETQNTLMVFGFIFLVVALVLLVRSRPPGVLLIYTLVIMGLALLSPTMGARPRFLFTAFPLVTVFAEELRPAAFPAAVAVSATLLGAFTVLSLATSLAVP